MFPSRDARPPSVRDDIFAWGATMYMLATGTRPFAVTGARSPLARRRPHLADVRPDLPSHTSDWIERALSITAGLGYSSMRGLLHRARRHPSRSTRGRPAPGTRKTAEFSADTSWAGLARTTADALCQAAEPREGGLAWAVAREGGQRTSYPDAIYSGAAGIALFLASGHDVTGDETCRDVVHGAARWLSSAEWGHGSRLCGLHVGEAGIGHFYLVIADLLGVPGYLEMAQLRARRLDGVEPVTLDLVGGAAGLLLFLQELHDATSDSTFGRAALELSNEVLARSEATDAGLYWEVPDGWPGGATHSYLGLLHGAAGIGLALLTVGVRQRERQLIDAAAQVGDQLLSCARLDLDTEHSALTWTWPLCLGDPTPTLSRHCHGGGGISQFLIRLWLARGDCRFLGAAVGAAETVASRDPAHSSLCHGLAGDGMLFLDLYQATGDERWRARATGVARRLAGHQGPEPGGWRGSAEQEGSPGLMTGDAGVGAFLLRLSHAEDRPDLLLPSIDLFRNAPPLVART